MTDSTNTKNPTGIPPRLLSNKEHASMTTSYDAIIASLEPSDQAAVLSFIEFSNGNGTIAP
jgi:hypothetical protein